MNKAYSRAQTIDQSFQSIQSGEIEFSQLRSSLEKAKLAPEEVSLVVRQVDKQIQQAAIYKARRAQGRNIYLGGLIFSLLGLLVSVGTFLGLVGNGQYFIVAYGPLLSGLGIAYYGRNQMRSGL